MAVVGWILLGILGLLLLILLLVLFLPIRYHLEAEKNAERLCAKARVSWLFGLLGILFDFPEPGKPQIRIAGLTINRNRRSDQKTKAPKENSGNTADAKESGEDLEPQSAGTRPEAPDQERTQKDDRDEGTEHPAEEAAASTTDTDAQGENGGEKPVKNVSENKKKGVRENLSERYQKFRDEADFYWKLWKQEETKPLLSEILARILKIFRNMFPREIRGKIQFGAASPDITGYALAAYSIAKVKFPRRLSVELVPDFENQVLEGEILIRGRVMLAVFIWNGLRILTDRRLQKLWRQVKRHNS